MSFRIAFTKLGQYPNLTLALIGSFSFVLYLLLGRANEAAGITATLHRFFAILAALFVFLLVAALVIKKSAPPKDKIHYAPLLIIVFAALFRLALLQQTPWLSNDIYRYLWDAQLVAHGVNPYAFPPAADELAEFRDTTIYPKMDHKNVHSVYPPLLQLLFLTGRKLSQVFNLQFFAGLKFVFILIDLGLVLALFRLLAQLQLDSRWAILYAWHPLPIVEIAGSGHTDGVGAFMLVLALIMLRQRKYFFAALFFALGFLVKFITILFLPFLAVAIWNELNLKKAGWSIALFVGVIVAGYAPFMAAGEKLWSGLLVYSDKWRFNDGFFALVFSGVQRLLPDALVKYLMIPSGWEITDVVMTTRRIDLALFIAKTLCGGIFAFIYLSLLWRMFKSKNADTLPSNMSCWKHLVHLKHGAHYETSSLREDMGVLLAERTPYRERTLDWIIIFIFVLAAFFLLSPTLQPWYLLWLLPLLCLSGILDQRKVLSLSIRTSPEGSLSGRNQISPQRHKVHKENPTGVTFVSFVPLWCKNFCTDLTLKKLMLPLWIFSATVFLSYFVLENYLQSGLWQEPDWVQWVEYGIPFGVWLWMSGRFLISKDAT